MASSDSVQLVEDKHILQIIDGDGVFLKDLNSEMSRWGDFLKKGEHYFVVAVLGCQSSGKSTLLNRLFGTAFNVMNAKSGRRQTTLGVWLGLSGTQEQSVLVLDVEGTDSRERGEDHINFERKTSLFSLALSEILIINMWTHHVGLHDAANYGLLKVVFELNLQLFQSSSSASANRNKTLLLFIFRDHVQHGDDATPITSLIDVISTDMKKIWGSIAKPEQYANSSIDDFFDFAYISLAHKQLTPELFEKQCSNLRDRFLSKTPAITDADVNSNNSDGKNGPILDQAYKKDIPADGFSKYAEDIWAAIQANKDINLPSQKEMLAMYRCEEISNQAFKEFLKQVEEFKRPHCEQPIQPIANFAARANVLTDACLEIYDSQAKRYHEEVNKQKRAALLERINSDLSKTFVDQVKLLTTQALNQLESVLKQKFLPEAPTPQFVAVAKSVQDEQVSEFTRLVTSCVVERFDWSFKGALLEFEEAVKRRLESTRQQQADLHVQEVTLAFRNKVEVELQTILTKATRPNCEAAELKHVWSKISAMVRDLLRSAQEELHSRLVEIGVETEEIARRSALLRNGVPDAIKQRIRGTLGTKMAGIMEARVAATFANDPRGGARRWGPLDDVRGSFNSAKDDAVEILQQLTVMGLDMDENSDGASKKRPVWLIKDRTAKDSAWEVDANVTAVPPELAIFAHDEVEQLLDQFTKASQIMLNNALRDQENAKASSQTVLVIAILVLVLGWNELMYILSNPLILIPVLLLGAVGFVIFKTGQWRTIAPFVLPTLKIGYQAALNFANTVIVKLMEAQSGSQGAPQAASIGAGSPSSSSSSKAKSD